jgi:hypothetical protein
VRLVGNEVCVCGFRCSWWLYRVHLIRYMDLVLCTCTGTLPYLPPVAVRFPSTQFAMHANTHTQAGFQTACRSVWVICLSFWACAATPHRTQRILEVLCKCEQYANTWKFFGRRVGEYAEDTCLPHSRKTTVVHCDTSSIKNKFLNLFFREVNCWRVDLILFLPSGETWFRLGVMSEDRVSYIKLLSDISETTNFSQICDKHSDTVRWTPVHLRENLCLFAARRFFISSHLTSRLIKLSERRTWNVEYILVVIVSFDLESTGIQ